MSTAMFLDDAVTFEAEGVLQYNCGWFVDGPYCNSNNIYHLDQH